MPDAYPTRSSLLCRIVVGDDRGWADFYTTYAPLIRWRCLRRGAMQPEVIDLVVQAVMRHFATAQWNYDKNLGRFRQLVLRVADLKLHEVWRELQPCKTVPLARGARIEADNDFGAEEIAERQAMARFALEQLFRDPTVPRRYVAVLQLTMDGRSTQEIADRIGSAPGTIRVIKHRMLARLRCALQAQDVE